KLTSLLCVPVRYAQKQLGNLYLINKRAAEEFSVEDQHSIEMLAERVGIAIEIARLDDATQQAIRSRDNILAIVSHDLRNPLSAISLSSAVLLQVWPETERRRAG